MRAFICTALLILLYPGLSYADEIRLERLNIMFEGNESAAAYLRHCYKGKEKHTRQFRENLDQTASFLAQELRIEHPALTVEQAIETLGKKQVEMAGPLDSFYETKGCQTPQARAARRHFKMFNKKTSPAMLEFLIDIENQ